MSKTILITGGCGFVGHHFVEHFLKATDWKIVIFDKLTYAANGFDRVRDIEAFDNARVQFFTVDLAQPIPEGVERETKDVSLIAHLAAESHVDRSISDPIPFVMSNVLGTANLLQYALGLDNLECFAYFGTDEVFGPARLSETVHQPHGYAYEKHYSYKEWDRYYSANPYAATKAGGEELCLAYHNTYGLPVIITHTMNCFGERQHPEKYIPMIIRAGLLGKTVTVHAYPGLDRAGSRFYIHCRNVAKAYHELLLHSVIGEKYNIVGEREVNNSALVDFIGDIMKVHIEKKFVDFHAARPGHDLRYALDGHKLKAEFLRGPAMMPFEYSLESTVRWFIKNKRWLGL